MGFQETGSRRRSTGVAESFRTSCASRPLLAREMATDKTTITSWIWLWPFQTRDPLASLPWIGVPGQHALPGRPGMAAGARTASVELQFRFLPQSPPQGVVVNDQVAEPVTPELFLATILQ